MRPRTEEEDEEGVIEALEAAEQATKEGVTVDEQDEDDCKCHTCSNTFPTLDALYNHQNELGHLELKQTPRGPGYLCWKKSCNQYFSTANALQVHYREIHATPTAQNSSTSRRHAYKFRCSRCSLAFVTRDKLQLHHTYHVIRAATRCPVCDKNFRSIGALRKHVDNSHLDKMSDEEIAKYRATIAEVAPLIGLKLTDDPSANNEDINANSVITQDASYSDPACKYKCHRCRVGYARQSALVEHNKSAEHKRSNSSVSTTSGSSTPTLATTATTTTITGTTQESESSADEKFNDPSKPFKCHVCVEAFAQRNNLEVHEGSNSHKQRVKEEESGSEPPIAPLGWNFNDPNKPYRCNLCKVSFANSPNFDIHKRSVLHMKHISRLPDYINRNCWQSDDVVLETPDGKISAEDLIESSTNTIKKEEQISSPLPSTLPTANPTATSLPSTVMPNQNAISGINTGNNDEINLKMAVAKKRKDCLENKENNTPKAFTCSRCSSVFKTADSLEKHEGGECLGPPIVKLGRVKPALQRHLLESFGFECVMQYNENQKREVLKPCPDEETVGKKPPELLEKRTCSKCNKNFSSVWVLKAHEEEIHENLVPHDIVQKVATKFRSDYDKKQPSSSMPNENRSSGTPTPTALQEEKILTSTSSSGFSQASIKDEMPNVSCTDIASQMMQMPMLMPFAGMPLFMPPILPYPGMELAYAAGLGPTSNAAAIFDPSSNAKQQAAAAQLATSNPKRARTRINDDQLKILRAHFDINNSPTEAQIERMSRESGLPPKVIKHWFRNTLFKERQRNKDSPYNFNNPPSTTLDLAEYEKTGKIKSEATAKNEHLANSENMKSIEKDIDSQADVESVASFSESAVSSAPSTPVPPQPSNEIMNALTQANIAKAMAPLTPEMLMQVTSMTSQDGTIPGSSTTPKRANRTRFTDHQVKTLQEYFEQNAYPKDDELEHLSKTLQLSPRVIVVWFQNARQKARKSYENQPPSSSEKNATNSHSSSSNEDERYIKTPGSNYQCKRCSTVFQRYYELIKHQKSVCFKEEETPLSSCNNSNDGTSSSPPSKADVSSSSNGRDQLQQQQSQPQQKVYDCEKCSQSFGDTESWREHQALHIATPVFTPASFDSAFAILQNVAKHAEAKQSKRKSDDDQDSNNSGESCPSRDKRLRTTILPEQLDYLYQKYQADSNPSRKQLESIADEVGLKKRVVQVWFQNTRARERKGQYRAHAQLIHKRCPFCRALFRAKTALESHLATKHPEEMAKGEVNVDNIPDCPIEPPALKDKESPTPALDMTKLLSNPYNVPSNPVLFPPSQAASFKKMYEEHLNKFITEASPAATISSGVGTSTPSSTSTPSAQTPISASSKVDRRKSATPQRAIPTVPTVLEDPSAPLDLSARAPSIPASQITPIRHYDDDNRSETYSESTTDGVDFMDEASNPSSPPSSHMAHGHGGSSGGLSGGSHRPAKRYRTQMTSLQIGVMKSLFDWYRTPSMSECELLGSEISLPKRVVQVWFQNARAKEKKARLAQGQPVDEPPRTPDSCSLCNFTFTHNYSVQDHIFTKRHIQNAMNHMRKQLESEGVRDTSLPKVETPTGSTNARSKPSKLEMGDNEKSRRTGNTSGTGGTSPLVSAGLNAQMMSMLGMPGSDLMMPLFLPSSAPGFPLTAGGLAPFMSGLAPGDLMYDPTRFGTPLQMLQIPQAAISKVQKQLNTANATSAYYTQDCSSIKEVSEQVGDDVVAPSSVDVGYICRKCQMVYPAKEGCLQHQSSSCYAGHTPKAEHMLKLEQRLYKCVVCSDKLPTKKDFLRHCTSESHKTQAPPSAKKIKLNN